LKLLIVSHVIHYRHAGRLYAYGPYGREIDIWADLFGEVAIAAPCVDALPPGDCTVLSPKISIAPQKHISGGSIAARIHSVICLPAIVAGLAREMRRADAIHVRCPGNLGAIAAVMAPIFSKRLVAKYAAQWCHSPGEPWTARFQKSLLRSRWWRGPVTVYGAWPNQPAHIVSFFTSILTDQQLARAARSARLPRFQNGLRVIYTGRLSRFKNVDILLAALARCRSRGIPLTCQIVGDGPERGPLMAQAERAGIGQAVEFAGSLPFDEVIPRLERADVLVLVSQTEGWPKSIAEGMAFGLLCIGSDQGFTRDMLKGRGVIVPRRDAEALAAVLSDIASDPARYDTMRQRSAEWARQFSLNGLRDRLAALLTRHWGVEIAAARGVTAHAGVGSGR
jgi:glycosyltransferase involved in cell wall biosynthesis